ncbi:MAG TPA: hypothetical protein VFY99_03215 [Solirubrobacterales bacterium]
MGRLILLSVAALLFAAPSAQAAFHLMKVSEVYPGATGANPNDAFIELQMFEAGQNLVGGHKVDYYTDTGALLGSYTIAENVANGESQRKILIGDTAVAGATPDFVVDQLGDALKGGTATGGAVCFPDAQPPDCVSWGNFTPQAGFPNVQSANAPVIPDGQSLTRSTASGCPNFLEPGDDTDSSAADFALTTPTPENNNSPLPTACGGGGGAPTTTIDRVKVKGDDVKVKFSSDDPDATFECKLDKGDFKSCKSPKRYRNLDDGKHKVKVRATDADGNRGKAAKAKFKIG